MLSITTRLRSLGGYLADRLASDPYEGCDGVDGWGPTTLMGDCLPPRAPLNAWGWSPPNPPVAEAMGPDDPAEAPPRSM